LPLDKFYYDVESCELTLIWKAGVSSLEPLPDDEAFLEEEEEGLDVDEEALLADADVNDDYHLLMDVASLPIEDEHKLFEEDEHRLFDANSDIGEEVDDDDVQGEGSDVPIDTRDDSITTSTTIVPESNIAITTAQTQAINQNSPAKSVIPVIKTPEFPEVSITPNPSFPNSQIIRELGRLQVVVTADCKKSPPVIKVLAMNPYAN